MRFSSYRVGDHIIIPPQTDPARADIARLLEGLMMAARQMHLDSGRWLLQIAQSQWLKIPMATEGPSNGLPTSDAVLAALYQYVLGTDDSTRDGWFNEDGPQENIDRIKARAEEIIAGGIPHLREQILYRLGVKVGPKPSDLAMLSAGPDDASKDAVALDALLDQGSHTVKAEDAAEAYASLTAIPIPTGQELLKHVSPQLAEDISATVASGKLAPRGGDARYQRIRRAGLDGKLHKAKVTARKAKLDDTEKLL